jgi:PmbA protein
VDGRYSANSTSDLRPEALDRFVADNITLTRLLANDPHRKLPDPGRYANRHGGDLQLFDEEGAARITAVELRRRAEQQEQAARSTKEDVKIVSVTGTAYDSLSESAMATSNGMEGSRQGTSFGLYTVVSAQDRGDRKPMGYHYVNRRRLADLPSVEVVGQEAVRRVMMELGAKPEKSGLYPCVIENRVVGRLLGGFRGPLSGNAIQQRRSFLADKLGKKIAAPVLTIVDDPWRPGGMASMTYDSEGMSTIRRPIIEKGVLKSFYLDTYYASKLGKEATIGSSTNLVFDLGNRDLAGLLRAMKRGILITGFSGGNSNSATGDFSIGIRGQWIEDGKPVRPVAEMNLAGNHLKFWANLVELGNDPHLSSATLAPSLRFKAVQFSGA